MNGPALGAILCLKTMQVAPSEVRDRCRSRENTQPAVTGRGLIQPRGRDLPGGGNTEQLLKEQWGEVFLRILALLLKPSSGRRWE